MNRYRDPENQRHQYMVSETINGYSIEVLVIPTGDIIPLTPQVASKIGIVVPDQYRVQCCTREAAEETLTQLAEVNGWVPL